VQTGRLTLSSPLTIQEILKRRYGCPYSVRIRSNHIRDRVERILLATGSAYLERAIRQPVWNVNDTTVTEIGQDEGIPGLGVRKALAVMGLYMWEVSPWVLRPSYGR
jgi:hypothetical protein